ncbi:hypothetical protein [Haliangium sp.]|uniref:hypothetical protein n=1 Tax=Haliangium sp. TaxID=2663208 RepID=UPI003D0D6D20
MTLDRRDLDDEDRGGGLYVGIFVLWPLAAAIAMLLGVPLAFVLGAPAHVMLPVGFAVVLALLYAWQAWERSLWRQRRLALGDQRFVPVADLGDLGTASEGQAVRVRGRVRARAGLTELYGVVDAADTPAVVYERARASAGWRAPMRERGCDFELVDGRGHAVAVELAEARVLPLRSGRRLQVVRAGDEVEVTGCVGARQPGAALPRESARRVAIGARGALAVTVVALGADAGQVSEEAAR